MIRFRIGQSWKREPNARPMDAFGLELDGVDLLVGASEEALDRVVVDLANALAALSLEGKSFAELALPEAHLELLFRRDGYEVDLQVISLGRPARRVRGPLRVDLEDLCAAAVKCARGLLQDVSEAAPRVHPQLRRALSKKVQALETQSVRQRPATPPGPGFSHRHQPAAPLTFWFDLEDPQDLVSGYQADDQGALGPLMAAGGMVLRVGDEPLWQARGTPFLMMLELARQAQDLVHALELEEPSFRFAPGGIDPAVDLDLKRGLLRVRKHEVEVSAQELARAMFDAGQHLAVALTTQNRAQAKNPWLMELVDRCREGQSRLGTAIRPVDDERPARGKRKRAAEKPLHVSGRLRRLRFDKRWEKQIAEDEDRGRLLLGRRGPIYSSPHVVSGFSARGELLFRHAGSHGVAVDDHGFVITASPSRVVGFPNGLVATWLRDHDGLPVGPELHRREGLCVVGSNGRSAMAFSEVTGREVWRLSPPRTQRSFISLQAHRALVATDSGYLYGLDLGDGQVRFRMRSAMPFTGPTVPWGRRVLATIGRGDKSVVFAADAHSGNVVWAQELTLGAISRPLVLRSKIFVAGEEDREGTLLCLSARGKPLWQRRLHLGTAPFQLQAVGRSVVAVSQSGAAMMFTLDGLPEWRLGASGEELPFPVAPCTARGVLIVPGETTRAVDPRGGRVLGELRTGIGLVDVAVDSRLNVYALDEDGTLSAYRLTTSLAVV